jgi:steroid delta-isomerase-like uncharacterized protein
MRLHECHEAMEKKDMDKLAGCYTADAVGFVSDMSDQVTGFSAIMGLFEPIHAAFSDFHHMPVMVFANGNKVAALVVGGGTQDGVFMGVPATHKKVGVYGMRMIVMADGKIKYDAHTTDPATWMGQLGAAPIPHRDVVDFAKLPEKPMVVLAKQDDKEKANVAAIQAGCELFNKHDVGKFLENWTDTAVMTDYTAPADTVGKKAINALLTGLFKAFPDMTGTCEPWGAGDYVVNWVDWTATNRGTFPGFIKKATNKQVHIHDAEIYQFENGKVVHYWRLSNGLALAAQLGLLPPAAKPTATKKAETPAKKPAEKVPAKK